ncbi:hypothetical protein TNCV_3676361 [Trichonephila clavipes]|nr:hypothetical protein TNCV_3676361 [Trichonephila clavipes]
MSTLDLGSGYFQLAVSPTDIPKTVFVTKNGAPKSEDPDRVVLQQRRSPESSLQSNRQLKEVRHDSKQVVEIIEGWRCHSNE